MMSSQGTDRRILSSILFIFLKTVSSTTLIRRDLAGYELARCNDGSTASYYYQQDVRFAEQDVLIYLPDGGACGTIEDCRNRCGNGSPEKNKCTAATDQVVERFDGIWSNNPLVNPFADHFKVSIHYCSSDNYAGTRGASRLTGNYYFHGKHILTAALEDLSIRFGLDTVRSLTLVGAGAGARGVGYNCDFVASLLPGVRVKCIADSPDMTPYWVRTEDCGKRDYEKEESEKILWGREDDESCVEENKSEVNSSELAHRCGIWSRYWPYIDTPFFIVGSQFDPRSFSADPCVPATSDPDYAEFELAWRRGITALYESMAAKGKKTGDFFVPDCRIHNYLEGDLADSRLENLKIETFESNQTITLSESLRSWLNESSALRAIDGVVKGNRECPGPAPLCRTASCAARRSLTDYPLVRRRLLPPSNLFPNNYSRRCCLDPFYDYGYGGGRGRFGLNNPGSRTGLRGRINNVLGRRGYAGIDSSVLGSDKRSRLYKRLIYLQYLRRLYNQHKNEYAREYYGYDNYDGYDLDPVYNGARIPDLRGNGNIGIRSRGRVSLSDLIGSDYYDDNYGDYGSGILYRIRNALRLRKGGDLKDLDDEDILKVLEDEDFDYEDFGPLTEEIETSTK